MPSTPTAITCSTAGVPCACTVTGRPAAWARSTIRRSSVVVNWVRITSLPGALMPPEAITLTTSTPRSNSFGDGADDLGEHGDFPTQEVTVPCDAGQRRPGRDDGRLARARGALPVSALDDAEAPVAQVTHGGHARGKLLTLWPWPLLTTGNNCRALRLASEVPRVRRHSPNTAAGMTRRVLSSSSTDRLTKERVHGGSRAPSVVSRGSACGDRRATRRRDCRLRAS